MVMAMIIKMMVMSDDGDGDDHQDDGDLHHRNQVIAAEGEQKASRALKEAADVIQESPQALQVEIVIGQNFDVLLDMIILSCATFKP